MEKISLLIGKGGSVVKAMTEESGVTNISISQDGAVDITAPSDKSMQKALQLIAGVCADVEQGKIYR